ncbi:hypothetical protein SAMN04488096_10520 [Mesonia phycicola]|uniref:Outer membrane protein beta-barrel domain-containing protein n=1 Tax=Mesonia phycicola TaxID=579105 RepID=A0A1M6ECG1_9FLAO|nr:hypothetical protein [Mesonia phycicola]SHI83197.1 hypothetical protein SAMN04488096_10520 [Mesonia phycicola]
MKKIFFLLSLILFNSSLIAQNEIETLESVESSIFGVQAGFLGVWVNNEAKISNTIALKTEVGLDAALFGGSIYYEEDEVNYAFAPVITAEPRWYYNISKRANKGKRTAKNTANFVGLEVSYNPNLFVISNVDVDVYNQIRIIPKWAIRRTIGNHFTYETGLGLGYRRAFFDESDYLFPPDKGEVILDLHIRLGYTF